MTITLTREEAQKLLDGFDRVGWARTEHADILRARLAQPELEQTKPESQARCKHGVWSADHCYQCEAQPEPPCKTGSQCIGGKCPQCVVDEPEPVAWVRNLTDPQPHCVTDLKYCSVAQMDRGDHLKYIPLYTAPPQREQIVYCGCGDGIVPDDGAECGTCVSMRQRNWQGLTDEEVRNEAKNHVFDESFFNGAIWARGQIMGKNNE